MSIYNIERPRNIVYFEKRHSFLIPNSINKHKVHLASIYLLQQFISKFLVSSTGFPYKIPLRMLRLMKCMTSPKTNSFSKRKLFVIFLSHKLPNVLLKMFGIFLELYLYFFLFDTYLHLK